MAYAKQGYCKAFAPCAVADQGGAAKNCIPLHTIMPILAAPTETKRHGQSQLVDWLFRPVKPKRCRQALSGLFMRILITALAFCGILHSTQAVAQTNTVVVELFTSQGCSSCPPADEILRSLAVRDDVIALALHVDYWDYIGWVDVFGRPEHTARQQAYANAAKVTTIYTPQMIIGGVDHMVGSRLMQVMETLQAHSRQQSAFDVRLTRSGSDVTIAAEPGLPGDYDVQLVRYTPLQTVDIRRGENAGSAFSYANVVTSWDVLQQWNGTSPLRISATAEGSDPVVVIIQRTGHGPIVGAARLR
jgi:hypothetical protein